MEQQKFNNEAPKLFKRTTPSLLVFAISIQILLIGCASINRTEESISDILAKENALIEKVKLERAEAKVSEAIHKNESLKKAEAHLTLALDEILKANDIVTTKLLKQNQMEVKLEQGERSKH